MKETRRETVRWRTNIKAYKGQYAKPHVADTPAGASRSHTLDLSSSGTHLAKTGVRPLGENMHVGIRREDVENPQNREGI